MTTLSFHGAAQTVTGSKYLLRCGADSLLVDCGMFQGLKSLRLKNWEPLPFDPKALGTVALTHTHVDHCGTLPRLVREGFRGPVLCTPATAELLPIVLMDAAKLQKEDADYYNEKGLSKHKPAMPLFTEQDVQTTLGLLKPVEYGATMPVGASIKVRFRDVGHILGSAMIEAAAEEGGKTTTVLFSGDVGRYNTPLPPDPEDPPACDYYVVESTYGNRLHSQLKPHDELERLIQKVVASRGVLLVPAFAVGRTQQILFILQELENAGRVPKLPIHVDSPMAFDTTKVYMKFIANRGVRMDAVKGGGSIVGDNVKLHRSQAESKRLADTKGPAIIISSSGMLAGGRILHHMRRFMPRPTTVLALAGYQAEGTRGRLLLEGRKTLKIFGVEVEIRGEVVDMGGFSGHADADELMRWLSAVKAPVKKVFVTHGEMAGATALAARLKAERGWETAVPAMHEEATL